MKKLLPIAIVLTACGSGNGGDKHVFKKDCSDVDLTLDAVSTLLDYIDVDLSITGSSKIIYAENSPETRLCDVTLNGDSNILDLYLAKSADKIIINGNDNTVCISATMPAPIFNGSGNTFARDYCPR